MSLYTDENIKPEPVMDLYNTHEVENLVAENAELKAQVGIDVITHGRLGYEIESLKGQVENLSALWEIAHAERSEAMLELTTLQSKSAALVDALTNAQSLMPCQMYKEALALQPSPEILAARDQRVAEAISKLCDRMQDARNENGYGCAAAIRAGEWREYL